MKRFFAALLLFSVFSLSACRQTFSQIDAGQPSMNSISIAYAEAPSTYSPLSYEAKNRKFVSNIYETLVKFDSTFNIDSSLAVSWGRLDDTTWDFHLRTGVYFHDGKTFTAADAVYSLDLARSDSSELAPLLSTIAAVTQTEDYRISVRTTRPDPLLLNRLSNVYMVEEGVSDFTLPVGTGAYRVHEFAQNDLVLERFNDYWGPAAYFPEVHLKTVPVPDERVAQLESGELQVLANVPPQAVDSLSSSPVSLENFPSLELSFLCLNQSRIFKDSNLRAALWYALRSDFAETLGGGYLESTSQYAATGIEGYSATAESREFNIELAQKFRSATVEPVAFTLDLPEGLESLGQAIVDDLAAVDMQVTVNILTASDLQEKIEAGLSDAYFFGWKYDLADNADFFEAVVHSPSGAYGQFNGVGYANPDLDSLIEQASTEFNINTRREYIARIEQRLSEDQVLLPLFESKTLYAIHAPLLWNHRLDGQLWATDLTENVLK